MTENTTTAPAEEKTGVRLCLSVNRAGVRCRREATAKAWDEPEPIRCEEHQRTWELAQSLDGWLYALRHIRTFRESEAVKDDPFERLSELAVIWYEDVVEQAAEVAHDLKVADFIADRHPESPMPKTDMGRELGARLFVDCDALSNACLTLTGALEPSEEEHLVMLHSIKMGARSVGEALEGFKEENGLK